MLKMEIIKFEAQDVITTSIPAPATAVCECTYDCKFNLDTRKFEHDNCGCTLPDNAEHKDYREYRPEC